MPLPWLSRWGAQPVTAAPPQVLTPRKHLLEQNLNFRWNQLTVLLLEPNTVDAASVCPTVNGRKAYAVSFGRPCGIHGISFTVRPKNKNPKRRTMVVKVRERGSGRLLLLCELKPKPPTSPEYEVHLVPSATSTTKVRVTALEGWWRVTWNCACERISWGTPNLLTTPHYGTDKVSFLVLAASGVLEYVWDRKSDCRWSCHHQIITFPTSIISASFSTVWALFYVVKAGTPWLQLFPRKDWREPTMVFRLPCKLRTAGLSLAVSPDVMWFESEGLVVYLDPRARRVRLAFGRKEDSLVHTDFT